MRKRNGIILLIVLIFSVMYPSILICAENEEITIEDECMNDEKKSVWFYITGTTADINKYQFPISDIRTPSVDSQFNGNDERCSFIIFGDICADSNLEKILPSLVYIKYNMNLDDLDVFVFDVSDNTEEYIIEWLDQRPITNDLIIQKICNSTSYQNLYDECIKAGPISLSNPEEIKTPLVVIKDKTGKVMYVPETITNEDELMDVYYHARNRTFDNEMPTCYSLFEGSNVEKQNYDIGAQTVKSYLVCDENQTLMRLQACSGDDIWVEYYDLSYNKVRSLRIPKELISFGGFYETDSNYYLVTGQGNEEESADVECFRITKYDKNWNRISSVGLYDCNTISPFAFGSLRMTDDGKYLFIRTAHTMYRTSDGKSHQANVTIQVDMEKMQITDSYTDIMNPDYGYVSHSLNQFIKLDCSHVVAVDHGDGYPRSVVLTKYNTDYTSGTFVPTYSNKCDSIDIFPITGEIGQNTTGVSVGGFEISDTSYLIAGNSVIQDEEYLSRSTRNIFITSVSRTTGKITTNWITNFQEGDGTTSTPQFVSVGENKYILLWSRNDMVYYTFINGEGKLVGEIYNVSGSLSDCVPVLAKNKLIWYVWNNESITFYEIQLSDLSECNVKEVVSEHKWIQEKRVDNCLTDGYAYTLYSCEVCGKLNKAEKSWYSRHEWILQSNDNGYGTYKCGLCNRTISGGIPLKLEVNCYADRFLIYDFNRQINEEIYYEVFFYPDNALKGYDVTISNPDIVSVDTNKRIITMKQDGIATVRFTSSVDDDVYKEFTFMVNDPGMANIKDYIRRLYTLVLNRDCDVDGLNSWTRALAHKESSGVDTAYGFVFSQECIERNLSDSDFVEMLYNTFMNRPSDEGGKYAWVSQLETGVEREKVLEGFIMSQEFAGICEEYGIAVGKVSSVDAFVEALAHYCNQNPDVTAFVARCYTQALGRAYDPVGLEDWCRVILTQEDTPTAVAKCFIFSDEFVGKGLSDEEYVKVLYCTFMGREADQGGLAAWIGVLQSGEEDREKVLEGFANSQEFSEILESFGLN